MNWIQEKELKNKEQICEDIKNLNSSNSIVFTDDFGSHKALIIKSKEQVPSFGLFPVVHNRTEYDIYKVKTPKEANTNSRWFYYAVKNNSYVNERFEVVR